MALADALVASKRHAGRRLALCAAPFAGATALSKSTLIAVVDDDALVREALTSFIRSLGYAVVAFERAEDLLHSSLRPSVSCLLADVQMPGMTGPALHDRLVASGEPIPTILITAYPDDAAKERALRAGVVCYLAKPFDESDLLACLQAILRNRGAGTEAATEQ